MRSHPPFLSSTVSAKVELMLCNADGGAWPLTLSAGMERFVGRYPRIDGFGCDGPLLRFRRL